MKNRSKYIDVICEECSSLFSKRSDQKARVKCKDCVKKAKVVKTIVIPSTSNYSLVTANTSQNASSSWMSLVQCSCGTTEEVVNSHLKSGRKIQCPECSRKESIDRITIYTTPDELRIASIMNGMKSRCYNTNNESYANYGARGITVCDTWLSSIQAFVIWSIDNKYQDGLTIERKNNSLGYSPENCEWVDMKTQQRNRRNNTLTSELATKIRALRQEGLTYKLIQETLGVTKWNINDVMNNGTWK